MPTAYEKNGLLFIQYAYPWDANNIAKQVKLKQVYRP